MSSSYFSKKLCNMVRTALSLLTLTPTSGCQITSSVVLMSVSDHLSHLLKQNYRNILKGKKKQSHNALQKHGHLDTAVMGLEEASQGERVSLPQRGIITGRCSESGLPPSDLATAMVSEHEDITDIPMKTRTYTSAYF